MRDRPRGPVLIVDDDAVEATVLSTALRAAGYRVLHRADSLAGLEAVEDEHPVVVVLDWGLPFIDGTTFLSVLRIGLPTPPPVIALRAIASKGGARDTEPPSAEAREGRQGENEPRVGAQRECAGAVCGVARPTRGAHAAA